MAQKTEYELLLEMAAKLDPSYRTAMENARKGVRDVGEGAKESADEIGVMDIALGNLVANGISALISAGKDAVTSIYGMAEETREFRQDMATLETAFDDAGFSVKTATDTWEDLYAIFGEDDRAVEAANNISRMAKSEEELNEWVTITTGIWGKFQDALPVESLAEAASESAKVGSVVGTFADALNWGAAEGETFGVVLKANTKANKEWNDAVKNAASAEDYFNLALQECTTEAERQALINETLLKIYGSAAEQYEETAGSVMDANREQADYLQTQAEMGEKIEPVTTAVKHGMNDLMTAGLQLFANVDFAAWAGKIEGGFSWFINTGLPFLKQNFPILAAMVGGLTTAILAQAAANGVKTLTDKAAAAQMTLTAYAQTALNNAMKANPIGLIITGITLLVGAFMLLWNNCEGFRNFWIGLWDGIKNAVTGGINGIITMLNWFIEKINTISIGPLPNWSILGEYAGAEIGFSIPKIPMLAKGGIATGPTLAMVGEGREDEAIMPLSKLSSLMGDTGGTSIVYSPNITVMPGANGADVKAAVAESFEQFKVYMDRYLRERKRLQFS